MALSITGRFMGGATRRRREQEDAGETGGDAGPREVLTDIFTPGARIRMTLGDPEPYRQFRHLEPNLVSLADGKPGEAEALEVLVAWRGQEAVGALSFLVQENARKPPPENRYGRIDIVIVPEAARGVGLGKLLLVGANALLLRLHGEALYSISCLAAHGAVSRTLEGLGYRPRAGGAHNYVHEELRLEGAERETLKAELIRKTGQCLKEVSYNLRQKQNRG